MIIKPVPNRDRIEENVLVAACIAAFGLHMSIRFSLLKGVDRPYLNVWNIEITCHELLIEFGKADDGK
jgi:hypothetical protein